MTSALLAAAPGFSLNKDLSESMVGWTKTRNEVKSFVLPQQ